MAAHNASDARCRYTSEAERCPGPGFERVGGVWWCTFHTAWARDRDRTKARGDALLADAREHFQALAKRLRAGEEVKLVVDTPMSPNEAIAQMKETTGSEEARSGYRPAMRAREITVVTIRDLYEQGRRWYRQLYAGLVEDGRSPQEAREQAGAILLVSGCAYGWTPPRRAD